jgi:hypothetical protein
MIDFYPKKCNLCGGKVIYTSNAEIYGKEYGSGKCYLCVQCGAYVGTHKPRPKEALGLLANEEMRKMKMICHDIFDSKWKGKKKASKKRTQMYWWLAKKLNIKIYNCHFGHFDIDMLKKAYKVLMEIKDKEIDFQNGEMVFVNKEQENER